MQTLQLEAVSEVFPLLGEAVVLRSSGDLPWTVFNCSVCSLNSRLF